MDETERAMAQRLYQLHVELFNRHGDEIEALRKANESLLKSHEVIGEMLRLMARLPGLSSR